MAYKTLIIDIEELTDIKTGLDFIHDEMSNIDDITKRINELIGNPEPDLKGAVSDFDGSWDDNRKEIVDSAAKMSEATQHTIEDWNKWDADAAKAVSPDGATTTSTTPGGPV